MTLPRTSPGAPLLVLAAGFATLGTTMSAVAGLGEPDRAAAGQDDEAIKRANRLIQLLESDAASEVVASSYREAFDAFVERMDAFDGPRSVSLARALHARAGAVWSAFCLEGALRRSAPAGATSESDAFREADRALVALLGSETLSRADRVDVTQRRAILAAGFGDRRLERAALGAALASGGVDGAQISGLAALVDGRTDTAARLFGALLDDAEDVESAPAWALRGHGLAALRQFLRQPPSAAPRGEPDGVPSKQGGR